MKHGIVFILIAFIFCGCTDNIDIQEDYGQGIMDYLKQSGYTSYTLQSYDYIVLVSETGCIGCDKSFSAMVSQKVTMPNILFIIMATGAIVDISAYKPAKNVIMYTYNKDERKLNHRIEYYSPKVVFLCKGKLYSTFELEAPILEDQLRYLYYRIKGLQETISTLHMYLRVYYCHLFRTPPENPSFLEDFFIGYLILL